MAIVHITNGSYCNQEISGSFELIKEWAPTTTGEPVGGYYGFITVWHNGFSKKIRVRCNEEDIEVTDDSGEMVSTPQCDTGVDHASEYFKLESEGEAVQRIRKTFELVNRATQGVKRGSIRGLVIAGPPGIGKTHNVMEMLTEGAVGAEGGTHRGWDVVKGHVTPIGLYQKLFQFRTKGNILVFDDCDSVWADETSANILKAVLDSCDRRTVQWNSESHALRREDIPNSFEFRGSIVFITNKDFRTGNSTKMQAHYDAVLSRCHYLDLEMSRKTDLMLRIKQIVSDGMLDPYGFVNGEEQQIVGFVRENMDDLNELSLRMVKKLADLAVSDPQDWRELAEFTCMQQEAKFRRLLRQKKAQQEA